MEPHEAVALIGGEYNAALDITLRFLEITGFIIVILGTWLWIYLGCPL